MALQVPSNFFPGVGYIGYNQIGYIPGGGGAHKK